MAGQRTITDEEAQAALDWLYAQSDLFRCGAYDAVAAVGGDYGSLDELGYMFRHVYSFDSLEEGLDAAANWACEWQTVARMLISGGEKLKGAKGDSARLPVAVLPQTDLVLATGTHDGHILAGPGNNYTGLCLPIGIVPTGSGVKQDWRLRVWEDFGSVSRSSLTGRWDDLPLSMQLIKYEFPSSRDFDYKGIYSTVRPYVVEPSFNTTMGAAPRLLAKLIKEIADSAKEW